MCTYGFAMGLLCPSHVKNSQQKEKTGEIKRPLQMGLIEWMFDFPHQFYFSTCVLEKLETRYLLTISSVQSLSHVQLFVTPWTAALQATLSITNSQSSPKPMSIESVMPSNHTQVVVKNLPAK